jgi:RNA polymerase sigma-B factor
MMTASGSPHGSVHSPGEVSSRPVQPRSTSWPLRESGAESAAAAAEAVPAALTLPDPRGLGELDERELLAIVSSLPRGSGRREAACEQLVDRYRGLVRSCVRQYRHSPETTEDLMQVGYVGLVKAINNFNPAFGRGLAAYARPYITGEIKRHFRDKRWQIRVTRSAQELLLELRAATPQLAQDLGRTPAEPDLARYLGVSSGELRDAELAEMALRPWSLEAPWSGQPDVGNLADLLGEDDPRLEHTLGMLSVAAHWGELPSREQRILLLRFYDGLTQAQIGEQLGISQMQVSRLLAHALGYLRPRLYGLQPQAAAMSGRSR